MDDGLTGVVSRGGEVNPSLGHGFDGPIEAELFLRGEAQRTEGLIREREDRGPGAKL